MLNHTARLKNKSGELIADFITHGATALSTKLTDPYARRATNWEAKVSLIAVSVN